MRTYILYCSLLEKCCLHTDTRGADRGPITPFTEQTLATCNRTQTIRQTRQKRTKFSDIVLPEKPDGVCGYHTNCYRYFNAIKQKGWCIYKYFRCFL